MKISAHSIISLIAGVCIGSIFTHSHRLYHSSPVLPGDTVTLLRIDTLLTRDTLYLHIPTYHETPSAHLTTVHRNDLIDSDSDSVTLHSVQRVYADSTFRAVVSGIDPRLDSLTIFRITPTVTHSITTRIPTPAATTSRWGLGLTAGITATPHGLSPGITLGLTYRLWP